MNKILIVFNEIATPAWVSTFAINTARENAAHLQGIFLRTLSSESHKYSFPNDLGLTEEEQPDVSPGEGDSAAYSEASFLKQCTSSGVSCDIVKDITAQSLAEHSREASLIIMDAKIELENNALSNILSHLHCPAYLIGINAPVVERVLLSYDGSESAAYAIKKYSGLFPQWASLPVLLVTVSASEEKETEQQAIVTAPFPNLTVQTLQGDADEAWKNLLDQYPENILVVMGAFGRSALSRLFHPSFANKLMNETRVSSFIAHK